MPCPVLLLDKLCHASMRVDDVMSRDFMLRIREAIYGRLCCVHRGIMKDDIAWPLSMLAGAEIRRGALQHARPLLLNSRAEGRWVPITRKPIPIWIQPFWIALRATALQEIFLCLAGGCIFRTVLGRARIRIEETARIKLNSNGV